MTDSLKETINNIFLDVCEDNLMRCYVTERYWSPERNRLQFSVALIKRDSSAFTYDNISERVETLVQMLNFDHIKCAEIVVITDKIDTDCRETMFTSVDNLIKRNFDIINRQRTSADFSINNDIDYINYCVELTKRSIKANDSFIKRFDMDFL